MLNDLMVIIAIFILQSLAANAAVRFIGFDSMDFIKSETYLQYVSNELWHVNMTTNNRMKIWLKGAWIGYKAYLKFAPVAATVTSLGVVLLTWIITPVEFEITRAVIMFQLVFGAVQALWALVLQSTPKSANQ